MKIFITGIESFVSTELVSQCEAQGIDVVGVDLIKSPTPNCYQADIRARDIADLIPENVNAIIHLAAMSRDSDCKNRAYECFDTNVIGTLNLIDAAQKRHAKQFVFASTEWVYDSFKEGEIKNEDSFVDITNHTSEYALSKLVSEANLRQKYQHGFCSTTILRFGIIYGPRKTNWSAVESIFNAVKNENEITVGSLKTARCFIHVSDIAAGIIKSIGLDGFNIINLQGDRLVSLGDIIETGKRIVNTNPKIIETTPNKASIRSISNEKAKRMLKWKPEVDLETGLRSLCNK